VVAASSLSYASAATPDSPDQKPRWLTQMVEPFGDTAGRPDPAPPGRVAAAAPTRSTKSPVQTPRTRTRNARTPTPGHRTSTPDSGQRIVDITCADTGRSPGHRTPDAWTRPSTRTGRPRHGRHRTDTPDHHDQPTARWTPNHGPVDGTCCARQRRRLGDDEVPASARLSTALPGPAQSLCRPSRALAHCSPRKIAGRA
jgi:hypothetical protein